MPRLSTTSLLAGCLLAALLTVAAQAQTVVTDRRVFHPPTTFDHERFGSAVDADQTTVVVGAIGSHNTDPAEFGRAEIWRIDPSQPGPAVLEAVLTQAPAAPENDAFGAAVAIYRDRVVIGAPASDLAGLDAGAAFVFDRVGDPKAPTWVQSGVLLPAGPGWNGFGRSVDVSGGIVVVGSNDGAMAFEKGPRGWKPIPGLDSRRNGGFGFGYNVAVRGQVVVVSEPWYTDVFDSDPLPDIGALHVFHRNLNAPSNPWQQTAFVTYQAPYTGETMGISLAMTAIGSGRDAQLLVAAGTNHSARLWRFSMTGQQLTTGLNLQDPATPAFGRHVAIRGGELLVSGDENSPQQSVQLYRLDPNGIWQNVATFLPPTPPDAEGYGNSLAISDGFFLVGSSQATRNGFVNAGWVSRVWFTP